jgi:hypothetical protein
VTELDSQQKLNTHLSDNVKTYIEGVVGLVEASREEYTMQYVRHVMDKTGDWVKLDWKENTSGYGINVGTFAGREVWISINSAVINGRKILFWHATSSIVDYGLIDIWIETHFKGIKKTDATNFMNVINN